MVRAFLHALLDCTATRQMAQEDEVPPPLEVSLTGAGNAARLRVGGSMRDACASSPLREYSALPVPPGRTRRFPVSLGGDPGTACGGRCLRLCSALCRNAPLRRIYP